MFQKLLLALVLVALLSSSVQAALITVNNHEVQPGDKNYVFDVYWGKDHPDNEEPVSGGFFGSSPAGQSALSVAFYFSAFQPAGGVGIDFAYLKPSGLGSLDVIFDPIIVFFKTPTDQLFRDAKLQIDPTSPLISIEEIFDGNGARLTYPILLNDPTGSGGHTTGRDQVPELTGLITWLFISPIILFGLSGARKRIG